MTNKELIKKLLEFPMDMEVKADMHLDHPNKRNCELIRIGGCKMTREEEKKHQSYAYIIKKCETDEIPDWEDVELGFQAGMEYADEHPIHYDGDLQKVVEQGKKEILDRVIEWLDNNLCCYIGAQNFTIEHDRLNKDLRKDMGL